MIRSTRRRTRYTLLFFIIIIIIINLFIQLTSLLLALIQAQNFIIRIRAIVVDIVTVKSKYNLREANTQMTYR